MKVFRFIIYFISLVCLQVNYARSAEILVHIKLRKPEIYIVNGQASGAAVTVVEEAFKIAGHTPKFKRIPWARTLKMFQNKGEGLALRHSMNEERSEYMLPILYIYEERHINFYKTKGNDIDPRSYKDLEAYKIGGLNGNFYSEKYNNNDALNRIVSNKKENILRMLQAGHVDLMVAHESYAVEEMSKEMGIAIEQISFSEVYDNGRYLSFAKGSHDRQYFMDINCAIYALRENGRIVEIYDQMQTENPNFHPYKQNLDTPESLMQKQQCENHEFSSRRP